METVITLWNAPHCIVGTILRKANGAKTVVVWLRKSATLSQNNFRISIYDRPVETHNHNHRFRTHRTINLVVVLVVVDGAETTGGFDTNTGVRSEHDGRDEDENAYGNSNAVAKAHSGG